MPLKRKQYFIRQYKFQHITEQNGVFTLSPDTAREHQNSENILYETLVTEHIISGLDFHINPAKNLK